MDDENKSSNDSGAPQGIFSTPELTVDTEKVNQASAASEEKARSRVASIFANTETGKQAQKLNDAMGVNSQPVDGDIVIDNRDRKKRSKVPLVLALVVFILAGVGLLLFFLMSSKKDNSQPQNAEQAFSLYQELIEKGTENLSAELATEEWFIFQINDLPLTNSERSEYLDKVNESLSAYIDLAGKAQSSDIVEASKHYQTIFNLLLSVVDINYLSNQLLNNFVQNGANAATLYINDVAPDIVNDMGFYASEVSIGARRYLLAQLSMIEIYSRYNCIINGSLDGSCVIDMTGDNATMSLVRQEQNNAQSIITNNAEGFADEFRYETRALRILLEIDNE